ncbi:MAG: hypothetical protein ACI884_001695 [Ulvibacter sp.]|jgi:hypothetical protein
MKNNFFFFVLFITLNVFSQESLATKGDYFANYFFGNATVESENNYKVNANAVGGGVGKDFVLSKQLSLIVAVEYLRIQYEIPVTANSSPLFQVNNFIKMPVLLRYGHEFVEKSTIYAETGIYAASLYKVKVENIALNSSQKENNVGFSFGLQLNLGIMYQLSDIYSFGFGLNTQADLFQAYNDSVSEIKIVELYSFQLRIGANL